MLDPSCDLERSELRNLSSPCVSDEVLQPGVNRIGIGTLEGLTKASGVQKYLVLFCTVELDARLRRE